MYGNNRQQRGGGRNNGGGEERDFDTQRSQRPPLEWKVVHRVESGVVKGAVSAARSDRGGDLFSFEFFKEGREGKPKKHFDARDIPALRDVLGQLEDYVDSFRTKSTTVG